MKRREFIAGLGSSVAWPLAVRALEAIPVIGYLSAGLPDRPAATDRQVVEMRHLWRAARRKHQKLGRTWEETRAEV